MQNKDVLYNQISSFSKKDQIEIILNGFNDERLFDYIQTHFLSAQEIAQNFNVTKEDILEYCKKIDIKTKVLGTNLESYDGVYIIKELDAYVYFYQERGVRTTEKKFNTYDEALAEYVNDLIEGYLKLKK